MYSVVVVGRGGGHGKADVKCGVYRRAREGGGWNVRRRAPGANDDDYYCCWGAGWAAGG